MKVPWTVARRKALARAMAIREAQVTGKKWDGLGVKVRARMVRDCESALIEWARAGILIQFSAPYREREDGWSPLVEWQNRKVH